MPSILPAFVQTVETSVLTKRASAAYGRRHTTSEGGTAVRILISGAGIAGPALALFLHRRGVQVTVVERAPGLRTGGSAVDFRGDQLAVLDRAGILDDVRAHATGMGPQVVVDRADRPLVALPAALFSGELEIQRGDLTRILHDRTRADVEYLFGDEITALDETADGVRVTFQRADPRTFDLVVGADGLHSRVRALTFGPEDGHRTDLGYCIAGFTAPNLLDLDHTGRIHNDPGRAVMVSSGRDRAVADVGFVFAAPAQLPDRRDQDAQKALVSAVFADAGWHVPVLLDALRAAPDLYFDTLSQIHLDRWSAGRVVLLGDAAWGAGPGGSGTGLALVGAYTLAGELAAAAGDHQRAFARYERLLRPPAARGQKQARGAGPFLAPATDRRIRQRNRTFRLLGTRVMSGVFTWLTTRTANSATLPDYPDVLVPA
jgi:2-polyprenyl-6-methoxyphenol hydroxylase-like FAD-dependent oxidoreductase